MKKINSSVTPRNIESKFLHNELFFSKTDLIGNIITGNSVFVRVSQFTKEELIGKPHNIIRHPDMPKVVFKVLWDYIKAGKTVIAYVKNMTKEGLYYWVLACVFPVNNGYLSIRIKPSGPVFQLIPDLYKQLLDIEESNGVKASLDALLEVLKSKGFNDYDSFMSAIIIDELKNKEIVTEQQNKGYGESSYKVNRLAGNDSNRELIKNFDNIYQSCYEINNIFKNLFKDFENILKIESKTHTTTVTILSFSDLISILALNSSIETYRLSKDGLTLSVISKEIKKKSEVIESYALSVENYSRQISALSHDLGLYIATSRLQADMISFFAREILEQAQQRVIGDAEMDEIKQNITLLIGNFYKSFTQVNNILDPLAKNVNDILKIINAIDKIIRELERTDVFGSIEAARIGEQGEKFAIVFTKMRESNEATRAQLNEFNQYLLGVSNIIELINKSNQTIVNNVALIKEINK